MKELIEKKICQNIKLTKFERFFINIFAWYDSLDAYGIRKHITTKESDFKGYYERFGAVTPKEKRVVMKFSKIERTKYLIYKKNELGYIPKKTLIQERKTPCGLLRLIVASYH